MKLVVAVPVLNQKGLTQEFLDKLRATEGETKIPVVIVDNGSTEPVRDWLIGLREGDLVIRNGENVGVLPALNQAYTVLKDAYDFIIYLHNDVMFYEQGWTDKLVRILSEAGKIGVAGFYGAKGIGTGGIYQSSYIMQQLIRLENVSGCIRMNSSIHGFRDVRGEYEDVAVMDGFSLIVSTDLLKETDGFDRTFPVHHMYDNDICLESIDRGYRNIVIRMDVDHLGGRTDVGEDWATPMGTTKQQVHTDAHPVFYEKWRPGKRRITLPLRV